MGTNKTIRAMNNDILEKGKSMPIGTITNGFKKIAEGKWRKVSSEGKTKEEHEESLKRSQKIENKRLRQKLRHPAGFQNKNSKEFVRAKIRENKKKKKKKRTTKIKSSNKEQRRVIKTPEKSEWLPYKSLNHCKLFLRDECSIQFN